MTTLDKAIQTFGFENPITITIATLEEQGKHELAERLFEECSKEIYNDGYETDADDLDSTVHFIDVDECGFDPYEGCYTYDC